jgi:hypothetical protein
LRLGLRNGREQVERRAFEQLGVTKRRQGKEQQRRHEPACGTEQLHEKNLLGFSA